jgi:glycosyltransferase involved in cell wall biosynthesis
MNKKGNNKINIIHVSRTSKFTGPENILMDILSELDKDMFSPTVILPDSNGLFYNKLKTNNIDVIIKKMPFLRITFNPLLLIWFLIGIFIFNVNLFFTIKKNKADIVICNTIQEALFVGVAVKLQRKKLIICFKNILDRISKKRIRAKFCDIFADGIIGVSEIALQDYTKYAQKKNMDSKKVEVIYDSINCKKMKKTPVIHKEHEKDLNSFTILNIGNLTELKGQLLLLEAINSSKVRNLNIKVLIIGDIYHINETEYKERLIEFINKNGLTDKVKMLGFQKNIQKFLYFGDVLVHCPIKDDAFPRVVLEAFCYKKIVIGTAIGGIPEMVKDNYNGFLCETDRDSLADKILYVYKNQEELNHIGENAFKTVESDFCLNKQVQKIEKFYRQIL